MSSIRIQLVNESMVPALQEYLHNEAESSVFHRLEWHRVIQKTYGHEYNYWVAYAGQDIIGVMPAVSVRFPFLGIKMLAMPYQFHSGLPLADNESAKVALLERTIKHASQIRAQYLELRHFCPAPFLEDMGFTLVDSQLAVTSIPLHALDEKRIRRNHRRNIRYAREKGVSVSECNSLDELRIFRRLYLAEGRDLGAPQAGWNFFENLHRFANSYYRLYLAWMDGRCIGGLLVLDDGKTVFARYAAYSTPEALALHVSNVLYWEAMSTAAQRGCKSYNCGISWQGDSGLIHWKDGWSGTTRPAYVYVLPLRSEAPQAGAYFEGFHLAKAIWRKLPLPVVDLAGRIVTRWIC